MESKESLSAEDLEALRAIAVSIAALQRTVAANQAVPPASSYGPYVDAVAEKAATYWALAELARVAARLAAVMRRIALWNT